jgi:hypothetical protein
MPMRVTYLVFAVVLFLLALFNGTEGGPFRDFIKASLVIGFLVAGSVALVLSAIVKNT